MVLYSVNAISGSTESQGEVTVRLQNSGRVVNGVGSDPDIVVASAKAYISELNKLYSKAERVAAQGRLGATVRQVFAFKSLAHRGRLRPPHRVKIVRRILWLGNEWFSKCGWRLQLANAPFASPALCKRMPTNIYKTNSKKYWVFLKIDQIKPIENSCFKSMT